MRRKISILLLLILLVSVSGLTLDRHYCNGQLVDVFLYPHLGDKCDSTMPMTAGSCTDDVTGCWLVGQAVFTPFGSSIIKSVQLLYETPGKVAGRLSISNNYNRMIIAPSHPHINSRIFLHNESFLL